MLTILSLRAGGDRHGQEPWVAQVAHAERCVTLSQAGDAVGAVMLMLTEESRFISGTKLVVDGGQNMWSGETLAIFRQAFLPRDYQLISAITGSVISKSFRASLLGKCASDTAPW